VLRLIEAWLKRARPKPEVARGIPMGGPLSPLLANVFLHPLDVGLAAEGWPEVRYADDFIVLAPHRTGVEAAYRATERLLAELDLVYEPSKTRIATFDAGFTFLGVTFEGDQYSYPWERKTITVKGERVDWLFNRYGPDY
jgi:retron-type reverse transcriptase